MTAPLVSDPALPATPDGAAGAVSAAGRALALAADPAVIERAADPGEFILQGCDRARAWLQAVRDHGDIAQIAECKSQAEAIRIYTISRQLGQDVQLAATEIVRRAERGIGAAIRRGQASGEITRRAGHGSNQYRRAETDDRDFSTPRPGDFASPGELTGNGAGIYRLVDGVPDEVFEAALAEAKAEGNLSRANLVRKIRHRLPAPARPGDPDSPGEQGAAGGAASGPSRGERPGLIARYAAERMTSRQIAARLGISGQRVREIAREHDIDIPADAVVGRTRRLDPARIARETTHALEGLAMGAELAEDAGLDGLDPAEAAEQAASMARSLRVLRRFARQIQQVTEVTR